MSKKKKRQRRITTLPGGSPGYVMMNGHSHPNGTSALMEAGIGEPEPPLEGLESLLEVKTEINSHNDHNGVGSTLETAISLNGQGYPPGTEAVGKEEIELASAPQDQGPANGTGPEAPAAKSRLKPRRPPRDQVLVRQPYRPESYVKAVIKKFELITAITGHRPYLVFDDFLSITEATLKALPDQVKAVGMTGGFAEDGPETKEVFEQVRRRYERTYSENGTQRVWDCFGEAFSLLLKSAEHLSPWCRVPKILRRKRPKNDSFGQK